MYAKLKALLLLPGTWTSQQFAFAMVGVVFGWFWFAMLVTLVFRG